MLLVNHSALSGLKNSEVTILTWGTKNVKTTEKVSRQRIASIVGWEWRSNATTTRWSIKRDTRSRLHTFESHGKGGKMGSIWTEWKTAGKPKNHLRNAARQIQKKIISPPNCDLSRKRLKRSVEKYFRTRLTHQTWLRPITIYLYRWDTHFLTSTSLLTKMYENGSMTGLPQKSDSFFGVASANCQTGGKNV